MEIYPVRDEDEGDLGTIKFEADHVVMTWTLPDGRELVKTYGVQQLHEWYWTHRWFRDDDFGLEFIEEETGFGTSYYWKIKDCRELRAEVESLMEGRT